MGVSHLSRDANIASGTKASGQELGGASEDSHLHTNVRSTQRPASTSSTRQVPESSEVNRVSRSALHPRTAAMRPGNGARMGQKSGQPHLGSKSGNSRLMSGGRAG